jgi:multiple sugar transport system substrate-binding protein
MPARISQQDAYFAEAWPGLEVNWGIVKEGTRFADNPSHEGYLPSNQRVVDKYSEFWDRWNAVPGLDLDAEIIRLQMELDDIFNE